jgi:hypothetical protein
MPASDITTRLRRGTQALMDALDGAGDEGARR